MDTRYSLIFVIIKFILLFSLKKDILSAVDWRVGGGGRFTQLKLPLRKEARSKLNVHVHCTL